MKWRFATVAEALPYMAACSAFVDSWVNAATAIIDGTVVRRIIATENNALGFASSGDIGGFVQSASNLSQYHEAWCAPCAAIMGGAVVSEQALVSGGTVVKDTAKVFGNAKLAGGVGDVVVGGSQWVSSPPILGTLTNGNWLC